MPRTRNHSVPVPDWWSQLATRAAESAKITHVEIARRVERITGELPSASTISRCLSGEITTVELMAAVSSILRIPPAVFVASSRAEAVALQREQLLAAEEAKIAALEIETVPMPGARPANPRSKARES